LEVALEVELVVVSGVELEVELEVAMVAVLENNKRACERAKKKKRKVQFACTKVHLQHPTSRDDKERSRFLERR
jgi:hypothetical protein